jgi:predicted RNA binding protein YcfA (HicA-like mRNA interferase family)
MPKLPLISGQECVKALLKIGFYVDRQKGSHIIMRRDDPFAIISVPNHRELRKGMIRTIIKGAGLTIDEFIDLL